MLQAVCRLPDKLTILFELRQDRHIRSHFLNKTVVTNINYCNLFLQIPIL